MNTTLRTLLIALLTLIGSAANAQDETEDELVSDNWKMVLFINDTCTYGTPEFDSCVVSGSVTYDGNGHITLRNATIRAKDGLYFAFQGTAHSMQYVRSATHIYFTLEGDNTIEITGKDNEEDDEDDAITSEYGYMTFDGGKDGSGSLTIRVHDPKRTAIDAPQGMSITNCRLTSDNAIRAMGVIFFDNADVHLTHGGAASQYGIGFSNCAITLPEGEHPICTDKPGEWRATICLPDGSPAKEVHIIRRKGTGLDVSINASHSDWPIGDCLTAESVIPALKKPSEAAESVIPALRKPSEAENQ